MNEFEIIKKYFTNDSSHRSDVRVGIGDDAAIIAIPPHAELAISTDTLIQDVHFPAMTSPYDIGFKSLAVNLSDLAAMGASPAWVTLSLTIPKATPGFLESFQEGFFYLAKQFNVQLIGGDLTRGPLAISITALGLLPKQKSLLRNKAKVGDLIYVTGQLGDAGLALLALEHNIHLTEVQLATVLPQLNRPFPRVREGQVLLEMAHAAIDISDGLLADLGHILKASGCGARINVDALPLSPTLTSALSPHDAIQLALTAGDDYELCFTIAKEKRAQLENKLSCSLTCIGEITNEPNMILQHKDGRPYHEIRTGYQHF